MNLPASVPLLRTRALMIWERAYPAYLPALIVLLLGGALGFTGWIARGPLWLHLGGLGATIGVFGFFLSRGMRRFRWPSRREALRRIEERNDLTTGCLDAIDAQPFAADDTEPLWVASRERLIAAIGRPRLPRLTINLPQADPYRLRFAALLVFLTSAFLTRGDLSGLEASLSPVFPERPPITVDAWIEPPAYTGLPPRVLKGSIRQIANIPEGSSLHLRLRDEVGEPARGIVTFASAEGGKRRIRPSSPDSPAITWPLTESGVLAINARGETSQYTLRVLQDGPPSVFLAGEPDLSSGAIRLQVITSDAYDLARGTLIVSLLPGQKISEDAPAPDQDIVDAPSLIALDDLAGPTGEIDVEIDAAAHPWAGLLVKAEIEVEDGRGQLARSEPFAFTMPERTFYNPLSQAVIEERQKLAMAPSNLMTSAKFFGALIDAPDLFDVDPREHLMLRTTAAAIAAAKRRDVDDVVESLWPLAIELEDAGLEYARARLEAAEDALREALRNGANQDEIAQRIDELRQAMNDYIRALAESGMAEAETSPNDQTLGEADLEDILQELEDLADQGANDAAESLLSQLEALLNGLQLSAGGSSGQGQANGQAGGGAGSGGQAGGSANGQGGSAALSGTMDLLQRQRELADETFAARRGDRGTDGLAEGQRQYSGAVDQLARSLEGEEQAALPDLNRARQAMERAADALEDGNLGRAQALQEGALEALRDAGDQIADASQSDPDGRGVDPLGRAIEDGNTLRADDFGLYDPERMRELINDIRKRLEDPALGETERAYLESLLERF
ncbi:MAG: DUF4175 family protein [Pseudomonadota bacterium]